MLSLYCAELSLHFDQNNCLSVDCRASNDEERVSSTMLRYSEYPEPRQPQDNVRGWWCIFGVSLVFIFNVSLIPTFGMLFEPFFQGDNDAALIIRNLFLVLSNLTILATGFLTKDLTAKNFVIIGSLMTFAGLFLSSFVTSLTQLIFTFPIMTGIGLGLLNPAAFVAVLACFTCQRTYAISIGFAALGFGQMLMPMVVKQIQMDFGAQEALLMVSLLSMVGAIGANFLVPIKWKPCLRINDMSNDFESEPLLPRKEEKFSILKDIVRGADLDLLANFKYIIIMFGLCIVYASSSNLNIVFPVYMKRANFDEYQINNCLIAMSVSDILSRLAYPILSSIVRISSRTVFMIGVVGLGGVRLVFILTELENYKLLVIVCAALGFFRALTVVNQVLILCDFCEENCPMKLPGTLGLSVVVKACTLAFLGWVFNGMREYTLSLSMNLYSQIILFALLILMWLLET